MRRSLIHRTYTCSNLGDNSLPQHHPLRSESMPASSLALVVLAGLIHAVWNIVAKKANGDARFATFTGVLMAVIWAPAGVWLGWDVLPTWGRVEWGFVAASGILHVLYYIALLRGYRKADLTVVYPLARGSGP